MFGVVLALLYESPSRVVPRQARSRALRAIPVMRESKVPAVMIAVDLPRLGVRWLTGRAGVVVAAVCCWLGRVEALADIGEDLREFSSVAW
jgi:hypothetical protein